MRPEMRRMYVLPSFDGLGADVWFEGPHASRLGGERTLVWKNVRYDWARPLANAWNDAADLLEPEVEEPDEDEDPTGHFLWSEGIQ